MAEALTLNPMSFRPDPPPPRKTRDRSQSRDSDSSERLTRPQPTFRSISGSWGVSGVGRGFDWRWDLDRDDEAAVEDDEKASPVSDTAARAVEDLTIASSSSPRSLPPIETSHFSNQEPGIPTGDTTPGPPTETPTSPGIRPSRRPPTRRISLMAGRHVAPPSELKPEDLPPVSPRISLSRTNSAASLALSVMTPLSRRNSDAEWLSSADPRTPLEKQEITYPPSYTPFPYSSKTPALARNASVSSTFSARSTTAPSVASEYDDDDYEDDTALAGFGVEADAGRGAYGLVKRARRVDANGLPFGVRDPSLPHICCY
ncbi:hypothetical protein CALVIDRAFT_365929 [Calocera viscosa TUFC12733]|uniref:Uncharacterized protein n=1 Tax=Calocera viscosa (strain TUFC12733) TaxID=1330018 RepID=A0A167H436_CALVF|nr:hypothetical protein CALVIDRAFT_365929 [Calocera viscosa TUFC12733]